ncbi:MAG: hypothetical protein JJW03_05205 [Desulfosarcina sp.]|nr:hypothetical protein [Desulfobacterales bacterium]
MQNKTIIELTKDQIEELAPLHETVLKAASDGGKGLIVAQVHAEECFVCQFYNNEESEIIIAALKQIEDNRKKENKTK